MSSTRPSFSRFGRLYCSGSSPVRCTKMGGFRQNFHVMLKWFRPRVDGRKRTEPSGSASSMCSARRKETFLNRGCTTTRAVNLPLAASSSIDSGAATAGAAAAFSSPSPPVGATPLYCRPATSSGVSSTSPGLARLRTMSKSSALGNVTVARASYSLARCAASCSAIHLGMNTSVFRYSPPGCRSSSTMRSLNCCDTSGFRQSCRVFSCTTNVIGSTLCTRPCTSWSRRTRS
mmetsp:Transcript_9992/g.31698  ORF Transcript_9992/g.31698 Transcript_9992/m.31698 type:complete len:232 (+) Transcript_9992:551-1246(+)